MHRCPRWHAIGLALESMGPRLARAGRDLDRRSDKSRSMRGLAKAATTVVAEARAHVIATTAEYENKNNQKNDKRHTHFLITPFALA